MSRKFAVVIERKARSSVRTWGTAPEPTVPWPPRQRQMVGAGTRGMAETITKGDLLKNMSKPLKM